MFLRGMAKILMLAIACAVSPVAGLASDVLPDSAEVVSLVVDSAVVKADSVVVASVGDTVVMKGDSAVVRKGKKRVEETWKPDPQKALWFSLLVPGMGQIYNRSYWKVPLIYGLGVGCYYVISFQGRMYNEYRNAYYSMVDDDPKTNDYEPIFAGIEDPKRDWMLNTLQKKMTSYRRYRDLCIFGAVLLYVANALDAFVDAHLYDFSISEDLSLRVVPEIKYDPNVVQTSYASSTTMGLRLSVNFK